MKQTAKKIFYSIGHTFLGALIGSMSMLMVSLFLGFMGAGANAFASPFVLINLSVIAILMGGSLVGIYYALSYWQVSRKRQLIFLLPLSLYWIYELHYSLTGPEFHIQNLTYMAHEKIHEGRDKHRKPLIEMGENAVPAIIKTLRRESPWTRDTVSLVSILAEIGEPAHPLLTKEIENEHDSKQRIYLIYTLQRAFGDFRYLPYWLNLLRDGQLTYTSRYLNQQLYDYTSQNLELPIIEQALDSIPVDEGIPTVFIKEYSDKPQPFNPLFIKWYQAMSKPDGPFPAWNPATVRN